MLGEHLSSTYLAHQILDIDTKRIIQSNERLSQQHNTHFFHSNQVAMSVLEFEYGLAILVHV